MDPGRGTHAGGGPTLHELELFVVLAEELHFGRAARRLGMAQPSLSQVIRRLETHLGVVLFLRTSRRVELTPAGAMLLPRARGVLEDVDAMRHVAAVVAGARPGGGRRAAPAPWPAEALRG